MRNGWVSIISSLLLVMLTTMGAQAQSVRLEPIEFSQMTGWQANSQELALAAFRASCQRGIRISGALADKVKAEDWRYACNQVKQEQPSARYFFEQYFQPYRVQHEAEAKLTGYYIPLLKASLERTPEYQWPIYRVPDDFKKPYLSRAAIEAGALEGKGLEIAWLSDPVMRFFLHVQGSGHIELPDGRVQTLQFAAKNGLPYTSIGKVLIEQGHLDKENVSLQTIRAHLRQHPEQREALFNHNESYIFFKRKETYSMPKGAQSVALTPMHSLAIDPQYWPYGLPIFLQPINRLVITQDTGSAIKGARRGDLFVGLGDEAEALAGRLNAPQDWVLLLPKR